MVKDLPANAGDVGWIPGLESSPGEGNAGEIDTGNLGAKILYSVSCL